MQEAHWRQPVHECDPGFSVVFPNSRRSRWNSWSNCRRVRSGASGLGGGRLTIATGGPGVRPWSAGEIRSARSAPPFGPPAASWPMSPRDVSM
jgi:hypothetical protein